MLTFRNYLTETLDEPYPIQLVDRTGMFYKYTFKTDDGKLGVIRFISETELDDGEELDPPYPWTVEFMVDKKFKITGKGDAYRIFATVIEAVNDFIKREEIDCLKFSADREERDVDGSRIKLYRRMINRFAKIHHYLVDEDDIGIEVYFTLYRSNSQYAHF